MGNAIPAEAQASVFVVLPVGHVQHARESVNGWFHAIHVFANTVAGAADVPHAKDLGKSSAVLVWELAMAKMSLQRPAKSAKAKVR